MSRHRNTSSGDGSDQDDRGAGEWRETRRSSLGACDVEEDAEEWHLITKNSDQFGVTSGYSNRDPRKRHTHITQLETTHNNSIKHQIDPDWGGGYLRILFKKAQSKALTLGIF